MLRADVVAGGRNSGPVLRTDAGTAVGAVAEALLKRTIRSLVTSERKWRRCELPPLLCFVWLGIMMSLSWVLARESEEHVPVNKRDDLINA